MKKALLLFGIAVCYLSAQSQISFNASPTTVTSGTNQQVTFTATGESNSGVYMTDFGSMNTINPNVVYTLVSFTPFNLTTLAPSKLVVILNNNGTSAVAVAPQIIGTYTDVQAGTSNPGTTFFDNTAITVNPYPNNTTYWNVVESGTYIKQSCGTGSMGSAVTYTVAAHTYSSTSSQTVANQLAINAVSANGQNYANANGTCTTVYARLVGNYQADHFTTHVVIHFYSDPGFSIPFTLPSTITVNLTWIKYANPGTPVNSNTNNTESFLSTYTIPAGVSVLDLGHMSFWATSNPPGNSGPTSDVAQSVSLQTDNPNFTTGANAGDFTSHD